MAEITRVVDPTRIIRLSFPAPPYNPVRFWCARYVVRLAGWIYGAGMKFELVDGHMCFEIQGVDLEPNATERIQ